MLRLILSAAGMKQGFHTTSELHPRTVLLFKAPVSTGENQNSISGLSSHPHTPPSGWGGGEGAEPNSGECQDAPRKQEMLGCNSTLSPNHLLEKEGLELTSLGLRPKLDRRGQVLPHRVRKGASPDPAGQ